jgi:hypothetical protein
MKAALFLLLTLTAGPSRAEDPSLEAEAGCTAGRVLVHNMGKPHWTDIKIEVNRVYVFVADFIPAGETLRFIPGIFTKSDGTRLDLNRVACKSIDIHATVDGKRRHWNGAYSR